MDSTLKKILAYSNYRSGFEFPAYASMLFESRVNERMQAIGVSNYSEYLKYLISETHETALLMENINVHTSFFFRDDLVWYSLIEKTILKWLYKEFENPKIWSIGCARGEELYSIAILLHDFHLLQNSLLVGTDINPLFINSATKGQYDPVDVNRISQKFAEKYFTNAEGKFEVLDELKVNTTFIEHDILDDIIPKKIQNRKFDLILCRNLIRFLSNEEQELVLKRIHHFLSGDGIMVLGRTEELPSAVLADFQEIDSSLRFYKKA